MRIERADADHHGLGQTELRRPFGRQRPDRLVRRVRLRREEPAHRREPRLDGGEEVLVRQAVPLGGPEPLVPSGAAGALDGAGRERARQEARDEVAVLDPAARRLGDPPPLAQDVRRLRDDPFGRVDATDIAQIGSVPLRRDAVDPLGLLGRGVVLPQDEHRIGVVREVVAQGERRAVVIGQTRRRAGGVHGQPRDPRRSALARLREAGANRALHRLDAVAGVLAVLLAPRVRVPARRPPLIRRGGDGELGAVHRVHQQASDAVRAEVQPDDEASVRHRISP